MPNLKARQKQLDITNNNNNLLGNSLAKGKRLNKSAHNISRNFKMESNSTKNWGSHSNLNLTRSKNYNRSSTNLAKSQSNRQKFSKFKNLIPNF